MNRKRIARLASGLLFLALIFFIGRTCQAEHADITMVFSTSEEQAIDAFEALVLRDGEVVATFGASNLGPSQKRSWKLDLDPGPYTLELEVTIAGKLERSQRRLEAVPRATIRIDLTSP